MQMRFFSILTVVLLSASLFSCSKLSSNSSACAEAGLYGDQSECQNSISFGNCNSTTVQTSDRNLVCWRASNTSNQTGNTNTNTNTGCSGVNPPWTMGAWTPSSCGAGITQRTRTVTCDQVCPCTSQQPSTTETCTPNMYGGKHYESECSSAGGAVVSIEGNKVCSFNGSCPSGWSQLIYNAIAYTITTPGSAQEHTNCTGGRRTVYTLSHSTFTPVRDVESLTYCSSRNCFGCTGYSTVKANIGRVACY